MTSPGFYSSDMTRLTRLAATAGLSLTLALGIVATSVDPAQRRLCALLLGGPGAGAGPRESQLALRREEVQAGVRHRHRTMLAFGARSAQFPLYIPVYTRAATDGIGWMASQTIQRY